MPYYFVKKMIMFNPFSSSKRFSDLKMEKNRKKNIYIYYSATRKGILAFLTTWMDFEGVMLNEVSNTEKDKSIWSHLYEEFGTKQNTHTHKRGQIFDYHCGVRGNWMKVVKVTNFQFSDT